MSSADGARLLERLLEDPDFRARFQRDPAAAAKEAGFEALADELAADGGRKPFETLEIRESRSSVAGVMLAAAVEGLGLFELSEHVLPHLGAEDALASDQPPQAAPGAQSIPPVDPDDLADLETDAPDADNDTEPADSAESAGSGGPSESEDSGDTDAPDDADDSGDSDDSVGSDDDEDEDEPDEEEPDEEEPDEDEPDEEEPDEVGPDADDLSDDENSSNDSDDSDDDDSDDSDDSDEDDDSDDSGGDSDGSGGNSDDSGGNSDDSGGDSDDSDRSGDGDDSDSAAALEPSGNWKPDPEQYGMAGGGGKQSPIDVAVLENSKITLDANGREDFTKGRMDPRVGALLLKLAEKHKITLSATTSDHPQNTAGGSPSNHWYGRAVDIATVNGELVRANSPASRELAAEVTKLGASIRPNEVGSPWAIGTPGFFTDGDHQDHIHIAFKQAIDPRWKPPAGVMTSAATAAGAQDRLGHHDAMVMPALRPEQIRGRSP